MTDLFHNGVDGVRIMLYGTTLDTPGRRELLNMQAVTAFHIAYIRGNQVCAHRYMEDTDTSCLSARRGGKKRSASTVTSTNSVTSNKEHLPT